MTTFWGKMLKRILKITSIIIVAAVILIAVFISPIVKYVIEKNSVIWTGRQITIDGLFLNFFTGSMHISGLRINEANSKTVFFECHDFYTTISIKKFLVKNYEINRVKLVEPLINVVQNGNHFNFDDLIKRFNTSSPSPVKSAPAHYWIKNIEINNGSINYNNIPVKNIFKIHNINFKCPLIAWNDANTNVHADFKYATGGDFNIDLTLNRASLNYAMLLDISKFDLSQYYAPLRSIINVASLNGFLTTKLHIKGNLNEAGDIATSGKFQIDDLAIKDSTQQDFTSMRQLYISIDTINVKNNQYTFGRIALEQPYFKFDLYNNGNNLTRMMVETSKSSSDSGAKFDYSNIFTLMASYVKEIAAIYDVSNYSADSITIHNGHFIYDDYTINDPFHYDLDSLSLFSGKISSANQRIEVNTASRLNGCGKLVADISVTPDFKDMDINYTISNVRVSDFNPYSKYYVATPFLDGIMKYESVNSIVNHYLKSKNVIVVTKIEAGKKVKTKPIYNLPIKLAVALLRDVHGDINLNVPVEGDLSNPKYKLGKIIWQIVKNIIVKAASAPFHLLASAFGGKEDDMKQISFHYTQKFLEKPQYDNLDMIAKILNDKKDLNATLIQVSDSNLELSKIALLTEKKQYYCDNIIHVQKDTFQQNELDKIYAIPTQDSLFNLYLNQKLHLTGTELLSVADKCVKLVGVEALSTQVHYCILHRNQQAFDYLVKEKSIAADRIKVSYNRDPALIIGLVQPMFTVNYSAE